MGARTLDLAERCGFESDPRSPILEHGGIQGGHISPLPLSSGSYS